MRRRPIVLALLFVTITSGVPLDAGGPAVAIPHRYDDYFRKYSKRFFGPAFDWRLFKAQGMAESGLSSTALSERGARGVMQLMPSTSREVQLKNKDFGDLGNPEWNIAAGIWYARQLWVSWSDDAESLHLREFMLGSYNAGRVPLTRAQSLAAERRLDRKKWASIQVVAPFVPRWDYRQTFDYIQRIFVNLEHMDRLGRIHP